MYGLEKIACITRMCTNPVIIVKYICLYIFKEIKKYCVLKHNGNFTLLCKVLSIGKKGSEGLSSHLLNYTLKQNRIKGGKIKLDSRISQNKNECCLSCTAHIHLIGVSMLLF